MINAIIVISSSAIAACAVFFSLAKRSAQITRDDAKVMWTIHRRNNHCTGRKWQLITRGKDKIIGFKCGCGYKYTQKRPLASRMPKCNHGPSENFIPSSSF